MMFEPFDLTICNELIERIPQKTIKNRIKMEMKKLVEDPSILLSTNLLENENDKDKDTPLIIQVEDLLYKTYNVYTFAIHKTYPFQSPNIKIDELEYARFLRISNLDTLKRLQNITKTGCLCCNSVVLCGTLWKPSLKIENILQEIRQYRRFHRAIICNILVEKIKNKYLTADIDLDGWLYQFRV
jgi:ubiquitin-protein ligase